MTDYERDVREKRYVEGEKLLFDSSKHLTTLCTGSMLVLIAFLEKIFKGSLHWKALVLICSPNRTESPLRARSEDHAAPRSTVVPFYDVGYDTASPQSRELYPLTHSDK